MAHTLPHPDRVECLWATHRDTLTVLRSINKSSARIRNFVSAEVCQKLHASITLEIWKRSARQIRACSPLAALPDSLDDESNNGFLCSVFLGRVSSKACARVCFQLFPPSAVMSHAESLRLLATPLSFLGTLEAAVAHDVQALL